MIIFGGEVDETKSPLAELFDGLEMMFLEDLQAIFNVSLIHK